MKSSFLFASILRESRGSRGRLVFFTACLAIGVAAVVGVAGLVSAIEDGIRVQSRKLLAADLSVESRRPLPKELDTALASVPGIERTNIRELATVASAPAASDGEPGPSRLVELKVIDGRFPFYGDLRLDPSRALSDLLAPDTAVVAPELASALHLKVGSEVHLGGATFRVAGMVLEEPDRLSFSLLLGPRVFVSAEGFARTSLEQLGSRVEYRALFRLPDSVASGELRALSRRVRDELPDREFVRVETHEEAQPQVRRSLDRVERFLGLVALLSLILGGTGVAQIVRAWLAQRVASVAVLRCIGMRPREVLALYLGHVALLALVGSACGAVLGGLLPLVVPRFAPDLVPPELVEPWQPLAWLRGIALGLGIAALFSLPPLLAVWRVSPARVLRVEAEPLAAPRVVRWGALAALLVGLFASAWLQSESLRIAAWFTGGLLVVAGVLSGAAQLATRLSRVLPRERIEPYLRNAVAALGRPSSGTVGAIVALGLGTMVVLGMLLIEDRLDRELRGSMPTTAPSLFLVDVQPDQWSDVREVLESEGATSVDSVPVVMARLSAIDGRNVEEIAGREREERDEGDNRGANDERTERGERPDQGEREQRGGRRRGRGRWSLTREQRLTWLDDLPADNRLVEGTLWSDPDHAEVSLEQEFARELGVGLGSTLTFDVQGVPIELTVTSLRSVEWQSFGINFFLVAEPGVLDKAPHFVLATARLPIGAEDRVQDRLAVTAPNVTVLRVREIVEKIAGLLHRLAFAVRLLGSFTVLTGIAILAGVVSSTSLHRAREAALLKTLGVTRRGVATLLGVEYALCGLVAGVLGSGAALLLAWAFLHEVVDLPPDLPLGPPLVAVLAMAALAGICGVAANARALAARPIESLR